MTGEWQRSIVWEKMLIAEVRSMYFAELASCYNRYKQLVTGMAFFLSSGAAAAIAAKAPSWAPLTMASVTALLTAYSMAVGLDKKTQELAELHAQWNHISADYERLWNDLGRSDAAATLEDLIKRSRDLSERATSLPLRQKLMEKWEDYVYS